MTFFRAFSPAADLAGNFVAGHRDRRLPVAGPGGDYVALPTICFEVAYDGLMRDSVLAADDEESLLVVQTNNATFGYTAESEQQFAISRIRAIEHGRSVVHVSTVGVSGFVAPDGSVTGKTGLFTAEQGLGRPVVRTERTPVGPARPRARVGRRPPCCSSSLGSSRARGALGFSHPRPTPRGPTVA